MCLLAVYFHVAEDAPVVVGANREEFYARGGDSPRLHGRPVRFLGGVDPLAGGTWLGINEHGLIAAVTNRPKNHDPSLQKGPLRSRGLLVRDLLGLDGAAAAVDQATRALGQHAYAGCNLLLVDRRHAFVVHAGDWLRVRPLPAGIHVLSNGDVNDPRDQRLVYALAWLQQHRHHTARTCTEALKALCSQAGNGTPPICLHGADRGTVSSTLIVLGGKESRHSRRTLPAPSQYLHCQGPPDHRPYEDYSALLSQLGTS